MNILNKTKTMLCLLSAIALTAPASLSAASTDASAKVTIQTSYLNVLGPITASTATTTNISSGWQTVLEQDLKSANNHDLMIGAYFETGLLTSTTVNSKNMVPDTSTATANIKVRVLVDGMEAAPGEVVFGRRTQQLSATLEGAIAGCLSIVTNSAGGLQIVLDTNCVAPETISLLEDTGAANAFMFNMPGVLAGEHNIQVQAKIDAMGDNQTGTFTAAGYLGKGTLTVTSVRLAQEPVYPYIIPFDY